MSYTTRAVLTLKLIFVEIKSEGVAQNWGKWRFLVNVILNLHVPKGREFLENYTLVVIVAIIACFKVIAKSNSIATRTVDPERVKTTQK